MFHNAISKTGHYVQEKYRKGSGRRGITGNQENEFNTSLKNYVKKRLKMLFLFLNNF
jgi:hypothetical protein